jgi:hypothetical protein
MYCTPTELDAINRYEVSRNARIAMGSMGDTHNQDECRKLREIATVAVANMIAREKSIHSLWETLSPAGRKSIEVEHESGAYAKRMGYVESNYREWFKTL